MYSKIEEKYRKEYLPELIAGFNANRGNLETGEHRLEFRRLRL